MQNTMPSAFAQVNNTIFIKTTFKTEPNIKNISRKHISNAKLKTTSNSIHSLAMTKPRYKQQTTKHK